MEMDIYKLLEDSEISFEGGLSASQGLLITARANLREAKSLRFAASKAMPGKAKILIARAEGLEREAERLYKQYVNGMIAAQKAEEIKRKKEELRKKKELERKEAEKRAKKKKP